MNRALFSGVAGLITHQTKMDVIGNNIANVNTYGYKTQRAVFSDVFYQTIESASAGTGDSGGTNPSGIGYGSNLSAVQTQMTTSSIQNTGFGMDVAITGDGFIQVMDSSGNTYYTKAGLLSYDAQGFLTDVNGNFVLGATEVDGVPASEKIKLDNIGSVAQSRPSADVTINDIDFTLSAAEANKYGNISIAIGSSEGLPLGQEAQASISSTGSITVQLNAFESFANIDALNSAINSAITEANGGEPHAAGYISLTASEDVFAGGPLTGEQITGPAGGVDYGTLTSASMSSLFGGKMVLKGVSSDFAGSGTVNPTDFIATYNDTGAVEAWDITLTINGEDYTGSIPEDTQAASLLLKSANGDYIEVSNPGFNSITTEFQNQSGATPPPVPANGDTANAFAGDPIVVTPSTVSRNLGLSSTTFAMEGGTEGGNITLDELSNIAIGSDGRITVTHPEAGIVVVGKISLATFANPSGLELIGNNYYAQTVNSGDPQLTDPGFDGSGALKSSALEMSNVDLSKEFADMITTQRGFQANSRIITVTDTMLEELINLKR